MKPLISVIIVNHNGAQYMLRCLQSIAAQTMVDSIEVLVVDNESTDDSVQIASDAMSLYSINGRIVRAKNQGFAWGINIAAACARGDYLFITNPDTEFEWMCFGWLYYKALLTPSAIVGPMFLNKDGTPQAFGTLGFDLAMNGIPAISHEVKRLFAANDLCFVSRDVYNLLGGYDDYFFLYGEGQDFCWRALASGYDIERCRFATVKHVGHCTHSPTTPYKRYLANRNHLVTIAKNAQHILLLCGVAYVVQMSIESLMLWATNKDAGYLRQSFWHAIRDCWRQRARIRKCRVALDKRRVHSDWWFLRFFSFKILRICELIHNLRCGSWLGKSCDSTSATHACR